MVAGKICCGFFQELKLHLLFPGFPLELAQPRSLIHGKRRLLAGMLTAVGAHPVTDVPSLIPSSLATLAIGRDDSITIFTASSLYSGEKLFFGRGKIFTFPGFHPNGRTVRKPRGTSGRRRGLSGAKGRPIPVTWGDRRGMAAGMMISRVPPPALPDLRPALRLAGPARPIAGLQGRRVARSEE